MQRRRSRPGRTNRGDRGGGHNRGRRPQGSSRNRSEPADHWDRLLGLGPDNDFLEKTVCPACESTSAGVLSRLGPTLLRKCRECGLIFVSPRLSGQVREEMRRHNPVTFTSERNLALRHLMAARLQSMHREMFPLEGVTKGSASLLEIGCGWGHFLQLCRPHYASVEGFELSREKAVQARERFDLEVSPIDIQRDSWPGKYNLVVAWNVLQQVPHPLDFLRRIQEHLPAGGQLALSTPNHDSLYRLLLGSRWSHFDPSRNLTYFTPTTLKALLRKAGFGEVAVHTSGRSLLRERLNGNNRIDRNQDARGQWLEMLRIREKIENAQEGWASGRPSPWKRIWQDAAWNPINFLAARGFGDQMRAYARKE